MVYKLKSTSTWDSGAHSIVRPADCAVLLQLLISHMASLCSEFTVDSAFQQLVS